MSWRCSVGTLMPKGWGVAACRVAWHWPVQMQRAGKTQMRADQERMTAAAVAAGPVAKDPGFDRHTELLLTADRKKRLPPCKARLPSSIGFPDRAWASTTIAGSWSTARASTRRLLPLSRPVHVTEKEVTKHRYQLRAQNASKHVTRYWA